MEEKINKLTEYPFLPCEFAEVQTKEDGIQESMF